MVARATYYIQVGYIKHVCVCTTHTWHILLWDVAHFNTKNMQLLYSKHSSKYRMPQSHVLIPVVIFLLLLMFYLLNDHFTHSSQHGRGTSKREIWCCCCSG